MSSFTAASATDSLLSASSAARSASTSPSNAKSHRLSISTAAARTEGERSASPRRIADARSAMDTDATGTFEVSARYATLRTSSAASLVLSTTCGMVWSEMASEPKMALRTCGCFSAPSRVRNACVILSSEKSPPSPPSCRRDKALAACALTAAHLSRKRSSITSSMRSYRSSEISASGPSALSTPATIWHVRNRTALSRAPARLSRNPRNASAKSSASSSRPSGRAAVKPTRKRTTRSAHRSRCRRFRARGDARQKSGEGERRVSERSLEDGGRKNALRAP